MSFFYKIKYLSLKLLNVTKYRLYYFGFRYKCPVCKKSARVFTNNTTGFNFKKKLMIVGMGDRANYRCPWCGVKDKVRLLYIFIKYKTDFLRKRITVLHVAPEQEIQELLNTNKEITYISGDKFEKGYEDKYKGSISLDITETPFEDDFFDLVICNHVLEHINEDKKAMKEIYRILKPGGHAILQAPICYEMAHTYENKNIFLEEDRIKHFGQNDHVRIYGRDYVDRLTNSGFRVNEINPTTISWPINIKRTAINEKERIYLVMK